MVKACKPLFLLHLVLWVPLVFWSPVCADASDELYAIRENTHTKKFFERALNVFTVKIPQAFEERLRNSYKYIDLILEIFGEKEIPNELAYLPLIESGFSTFSVGPGGAVGLWQFVKSTAEEYGLRVDRYVDERRDPLKATHAAADYLKDLYSVFGSWDLTLAAYNAGEGKLKHLMSSSYRTMNLPSVLKSYLGKFMAASTVAQNPEYYGFDSQEEAESEEVEYKEITTHEEMSLKTIAKMYYTSVKMIRDLNPALLMDRTPPYRYTIRVPDH